MTKQSEAYLARAFELQRHDGGLIIRRGRAELAIPSAGLASVVCDVLAAFSQPLGMSLEHVIAAFAEPDRPAVHALIGKLIESGFLVPSGTAKAGPTGLEPAFDIFVWDQGSDPAEVAKQLADAEPVVVGVNAIARQLARLLREVGCPKVRIVDDPLLRNLRFFDGDALHAPSWDDAPIPMPMADWRTAASLPEPTCVVGCVEFGEIRALDVWNSQCIAADLPFLPVAVRGDSAGTVGPLVVPGETACWHCVMAREEAPRMDAPAIERSATAKLRQQFTQGQHPAFVSLLADIAAAELTRFIGGVPRPRAGFVFDVTFPEIEVRRHRVLRVPRCPVCSAANRTSSLALRPYPRMS